MKFRPIFLLSLLLVSCASQAKVDPKIYGEFIEAEASYNGDNTIFYGDPIKKEDFSFTLKYEKKDLVIEPSEIDLHLMPYSSFTNEDIVASLTWTRDTTKRVTINIKPKVRESLKVLFIGNSFSDDTIQWMYDIAEDLGIEAVIENMYIGGCDLNTHYDNIINNNHAYEWVHRGNNNWNRSPNMTLRSVLLSQDWDFVSFQQASGSSGLPNTYSKLKSLVKEAKKYLTDESHTQFVWNMTWAYQGDSTHADFPKYNNDQMEMYEAICKTVSNKVMSLAEFKAIIPNGTAIQNARTSYIGDNLTRDGYHLSEDLGRYIAGLTAIKTLTGANIDECKFTTVDEKQTLVAKESANHACLNRFSVSESSYNQ